MTRITAGDAVVGVAAIAGLAMLASKHPSLVAAMVQGMSKALQSVERQGEVLRAEACMLDAEADQLARENAKLRLRIAELEDRNGVH